MSSRQRDYAGTLRSWLDQARDRRGGDVVTDELVQQIESQLEELQVAEEELRVQSGELQAAVDEAEHQRGRYLELFRNAPVAYLTTDAKGIIRDINRAASELLGIAGDSSSGKPLPLFIRDRRELRDRINRLARLETVEDWDTHLEPRKGEPLPVCVSATPVAADGVMEEIRWVLRDVRAEREALDGERALAREQAARTAIERVARRARQVSEASGRLMGVLDPDEVWTTAATVLEPQARAVALVEVGKGPALPRAVGGSPEALERLRPLLGHALESNERASRILGFPLHRMSLALRHGEPEVIHRVQVPGHGEGGPCLVVPLTARNETRGAAIIWLRPGAAVGEELLVTRTLADRIVLALETAELFEEVVRARRSAEEAGAAQSDFLSVVSHELRTPLTAIVSYAELLAEAADQLPEKLARYARQIAGAADHQRRLVDQVLSFKRLESGEEPVAYEDLDYRKPAELAHAMARPLARDRPIAVELELPGVPVPGRSDAGRVRQILTNLLTNAIRHTEEGSVRLTLETRHHWVVFCVDDTGEGIPPDALPRIFNRFWRGGTAASHRGGTGLGLTITQELVQRMHGEIDVQSEPGTGTRITVRLPRIPPSAEEPREGGA